MKSLRLNKEMRKNIVDNFLDKRDLKTPKPVKKGGALSAKNNLANAIHNIVYGKYTTDLPDELVSTSHSILVQLPNETVDRVYFGKDEDDKRIYKLSTKLGKVEYQLTADMPVWLTYLTEREEEKIFSKSVEDWASERSKFKDQVSQVVDSVNTTKQLIEVWPEAEVFLPDDIKDPSSINLPSINLASINEQV